MQSITEGNGQIIKSYRYDAAGHLISDGYNQFIYDARSRLVQVSNIALGVQQYRINGLGQRVAKIHGKNAKRFDGDSDDNGDEHDAYHGKSKNIPQWTPAGTYFVYDEAGHLIGEYNHKGKAIQETVWLGDMPVAVLKNSNTYYVYADHLNSPRTITSLKGQVVWRWDSDAFGIGLATAPIKSTEGGDVSEDSDHDGIAFVYNLRFPGQYYDRETGLHFNTFRDYDPATGRYIQSDPIGLAGGINTYAYVYNNPLRYVDPLGLDVTININRTTYTPTSIVGTIDVSSTVTNQSFSGNTLENATPPNQNLPVPPGTYSAFVRTDYTPNRIQLNNVPQASGVQIHKGNTSSDVVGCFAAGTSTSPNFVGGSGNAMNQINNIISADGTGNITVIVNGATSVPTPGQ